MSDAPREEVIFGANIADLLAGMKHAQEAVKESTENITKYVDGLKKTFSGIGEAFAAISAAEMFGEMIDAVAELASHLEVLSQKTGIAVDDLSRLRYAADLSHIGVETLDTGLKRLARSMQDAAKGGATPAAEALAAMGISATNADGSLRPMQEVLLDVADRFSQYEDGAAKSALAMNLFGRSGADMVPLLNKGREGIQALGAEQDRLNATMSEDQVRVAVDYENSMKRMDAGLRGVKQTISLALMPSLTALADAFTTSAGGSDLLKITTEILAGTIRFLGAVVLITKEAISELWNTGKLVFTEIVDLVGGAAAAIDQIKSGNIVAAGATMKATWATMKADVTASNAAIAQSAKETREALAALFGFKAEPDQDPGEKGRKTKAPTLPPTKTHDTRLEEATRQWQLLKDASEKGKDDLLAEEMDYWQKQHDLVTGNSAADLKLREQLLLKRLAAQHALNGDLKKAAQVETQIARDAALEQGDVQKQAIDQAHTLRETSHLTEAEQLRALANQALDIRNAQYDEERALAEGDVQKLAAIDAKRAASFRQWSKDIATINRETTLDIAKDWQSFFSTVTASMRTSFDGWFKGTQTFADSMRNVFRNLTLGYIASKLDELKAHEAAELAKRGITTQTALHSAAMASWAAIQSVASTAWAALKNVAAYAAQAAAAAWAAISQIPYVGPFLAPAAAGAALAGVLALGSSIASAAGGYDIPAGVNPVTQLHAQEMVLPAPLANAVRDMASGGGGGGGGGGAHLHLHTAYADAAGIRRLLIDHAGSLAEAIHHAAARNMLDARKLGAS